MEAEGRVLTHLNMKGCNNSKVTFGVKASCT